MKALSSAWASHRCHLWLLWPVCVLVPLHAMPEALKTALSFRVAEAHAGQWYRLLSGQLLHFTWYHTFYNACALVLAGWVLWRELPIWRYWAALFWISLWVGIWLWFTLPQDVDYRGASGVVYGMVALGLCWQWRVAPALYLLALLLLCGKVAFEQTPWFDPAYMAEQLGGPVAGAAHLAGLAGAFSFALLLRLLHKPVGAAR